MFYSTLTTASHTIGLPGVGAAGTRAEPPGCGSGGYDTGWAATRLVSQRATAVSLA